MIMALSQFTPFQFEYKNDPHLYTEHKNQGDFMLIGMLLFGACRSEDVYKEGTVDTAETLTDADGDGYFSDEDCDDSSSTIYPSARTV